MTVRSRSPAAEVKTSDAWPIYGTLSFYPSLRPAGSSISSLTTSLITPRPSQVEQRTFGKHPAPSHFIHLFFMLKLPMTLPRPPHSKHLRGLEPGYALVPLHVVQVILLLSSIWTFFPSIASVNSIVISVLRSAPIVSSRVIPDSAACLLKSKNSSNSSNTS